jgi:Restriction Enzyme Adenine Methylase Associated
VGVADQGCYSATQPAPPGPSRPATNERRHGTSGQADPTIRDLLRAGLLTAGQTLVPGQSGFAGAAAVVTSDGLLEVNGKSYRTPSGAGKAVLKGRSSVNGWVFWRLDSPEGPRLGDLRGNQR